MPDSGFTVETLQEAVSATHDDVDAALDGADSRVRRRQTRALAMALGGIRWLLQRTARDVSNEILPDLASAAGVRRWRLLLGLPEIASVRATGDSQATGTPATAIPLGTSFTRADGTLYTSTAGVVIGGGGSIDVPLEAVEAGTDGDAAAGVKIYLSSPIAGVDTETTAQAPGITGGVDEEDTESERERVLDELASPAQGGSVADFVRWTKEAVANTRTVYVSPNEPVLGEVTVRFIVEPPDGDPVNAIPSTAELDAARLYIRGDPAASPFAYADAAAPAPLIGDRVTIPAITARTINMTITNLDPDTTDVRDAVEDSLRAMMLQKGEPGGTLYVSQFIGAIDAAPGEDSHELTTLDGSTPRIRTSSRR